MISLFFSCSYYPLDLLSLFSLLSHCSLSLSLSLSLMLRIQPHFLSSSFHMPFVSKYRLHLIIVLVVSSPSPPPVSRSFLLSLFPSLILFFSLAHSTSLSFSSPISSFALIPQVGSGSTVRPSLGRVQRCSQRVILTTQQLQIKILFGLIWQVRKKGFT